MKSCVGIVLVQPDGSVLAQLRDDKPNILNPNSWGIVGGGKEDSDTDLVAAGIRELFEETNYRAEPKDVRFLGRHQYTTRTGFEVESTLLWAHYDGKQPIDCNEGQEIRFIHPSEFKDLKFAEGNEVYFRRASEKVFHRGIESIG